MFGNILYTHTYYHLTYIYSCKQKRVLTFGSYEIYKQQLLNKFPNVKPAFIYALSAILGDVTGSGWLCPSEVMKQQLQAGIYPSMTEAVKGIWKKNGLGGFYQGFTGGLARYVQYKCSMSIYFVWYCHLSVRCFLSNIGTVICDHYVQCFL